MAFELNKIEADAFGRVSAVLALNKPVGITSHDLVNKARRVFSTKKVGHAGTLDKFASGLMLILIGKFTKYSELLINKDKQYEAEILIGVASNTQDIEGEIISCIEPNITESDLTEALNKFRGSIKQFVSPYSSVKVAGQKLREIMRSPKSTTKIVEKDGERFIEVDTNGQKKLVEIPWREIMISNLELLEFKKIDTDGLQLNTTKDLPSAVLKIKIRVDCSKGTYIRQLAEDIGNQLGLPAMLYALVRTRIGSTLLSQAVDLDQFRSSSAADISSNV